MKSSMKTTLLVTAIFMSAQLAAEEQGHLNVTTTVQKEEVTLNDSGEREVKLVQATSVVPGDSVIYTITFRNISDEPAEHVVITNPVPENLTYIDGSAFGPGTLVEFSVDGGKTYGSADELTVADTSGVRTARAEDFTHLRWVLQDDLAAGSQAYASFRAVLN